MNPQERIYTPNQARLWGISVWHEMFREIMDNRELIWRLFMRDFSARYRQSVLGILWAIILPLIAVGTFVFLNRTGVLNVGDTGVPYPVYALLGLTIWQVFAGGLTVCSNAIVGGGSLVVKINFPKETLVLAAMGQVVFEFLVRLTLLLIVMGLYGVVPKWTIIFFPLTMIILFVFTLSLGFFLSLLNVMLRDVANMATLLTTFLMFLTPVVYPVPKSGAFTKLMAFNPLSGLVTASRDMMVTGHLTDPGGFVWSATLAIVFFFFAWRVFHMVEPRMAERM